MMRFVRGQLLLAAVAVAAALYGFATPALAHGGHNALPIAHASAQTDNTNERDVATHQAAETSSQAHHNGGNTGTTTCCGLSCMTAVPEHDPQLSIIALHRSPIVLPLQPALLGRGPNRLDRPPTV
jgi:hypothetical protein